MPLTDVQVRKAQPKDKGYRLADEQGLHLYVSVAGGKLWRYRYEFQGKEKLLSLGAYPGVSLVEARQLRDSAKKILQSGKDPGLAKKANKLTVAKQQAETFEDIAREWHAQQLGHWSVVHADDVITSLERDVFPHIGSMPVRDVTPPLMLEVLRKIESRDARETTHRIRQRCSDVFLFAIASARGENDPAAIVKGALKPIIRRRQPAVTDIDEAREVLKRTEETPAHVVTKLAVRLLAITAVRPGMLIGTPWREFDGLDRKAPVWQVPAERMKLRLQSKDDKARDHLVPLSRQAMETIAALRDLTGTWPYVFANMRNPRKHMSGNAMGYLLNRAGYYHRHVPHGWRSTFSTVMNELHPADSRVIDFMLAHTPKDRVEAAYNRALYLPRRIELAQIWADLIMKDRPAAASLTGG